MKTIDFKIGMFVYFIYDVKLLIREVLGIQEYGERPHLIVKRYKDFTWMIRVLPPEIKLSPKLIENPSTELNYVGASRVKPLHFLKKE